MKKERDFCLDDMMPVKLRDESQFHKIEPQLFFKNHKVVEQALLQCLVENDAEAFMEILGAYLRVNSAKSTEKKPNKTTRKTIANIEKRKSLVKAVGIGDLFKKLGI